MKKPADLLQGTLDMLILKAVSLGPLHGYGVLLRIQQISGDRLEIQQGSLYPAYRLSARIIERVGRIRQQPAGALIGSAAGRRQLARNRDWKRMAEIIAGILRRRGRA
jgi:hypothetical protein